VTPDDFGALGLPRPFDPYGSSFFAVLNAAAPDAVPDVLSGRAAKLAPEQTRPSPTLAAIVGSGGL
jgi:hypothetical protein